MDKSPEQMPYKVITDIIPPKVDFEIAKLRNKLITSWRNGEASAIDVADDLHALYWAAQHPADDMTKIYLMKP